MKKIITWAAAAALLIFVIDWGVVGLKIFHGDYDIITGAYIGGICLVIIILYLICKAFGSKCPHCGKSLFPGGKYCPHCGKKIK